MAQHARSIPRLHSAVAGANFQGGPAGDDILVTDPWRDEPVHRLARGGVDAVNAAVAQARDAFLANRWESRATRAGWLLVAADAIAAAAPALTDLMVRAIGKPRRAAGFEVGRSAAFIRACAGAIHHLHGETVPLDGTPAGAGRFGFAERVPLGVVAAVTPFNAPANLLVQKVAPAIVTGNAVVVKPAPEGAAVALGIARLFAEAGLPAGRFRRCSPSAPARPRSARRVRRPATRGWPRAGCFRSTGWSLLRCAWRATGCGGCPSP